jgi:hypothetical protein
MLGPIGAGPAERWARFADPQHPSAGGTVTPDLSLGSIWQIFFPAGNITVANPINMAVGDLLTLAFIQDGIGGRTVTWGNNLYRARTFALTVTAGAIDSVMFRYAPQLNWGQVAAAALDLINT